MKDCVFCDQTKIKSEITKWTNDTIIFEPLDPVVEGHRLIVPNIHVVSASDDPVITGHVFEAAGKYGASMCRPFNLITSAGRAATQTVLHLHVHYLPRSEGDGLVLPWTNQVKQENL